MGVYETLIRHGVTRLCHFSKIQSLTHILSSEDGVLATEFVGSDVHKNDKLRADGKPDYVCCTIEYPNAWYLNDVKYRDPDLMFREWAVLFIDPVIVNIRDTLVCECNAAKLNGKYILEGNEINTDALFDKQVKTFEHSRPDNMLPCCPSNLQAEVLIKYGIPRKYINKIAVYDEEDARHIYAIMKTMKVDQVEIVISPDIFGKKLREFVHNGIRPPETRYFA